jgi:spore coat protein U-like protein
MKTTHKIAAGAFALSALSAMAFPAAAQGPTATGTGTGSVTLVQPITISSGTPLAFGRISKPSATGTVTVTTAGAQSTSGGAKTVGAQATTAASFVVSGDGAATFSITPDAAFNMVSGANSIPVSISASAATGSLSATAGNPGTAPFTVGGVMSVSATQVAGAYSGTFNVVVAYN